MFQCSLLICKLIDKAYIDTAFLCVIKAFTNQNCWNSWNSKYLVHLIRGMNFVKVMNTIQTNWIVLSYIKCNTTYNWWFAVNLLLTNVLNLNSIACDKIESFSVDTLIQIQYFKEESLNLHSFAAICIRHQTLCKSSSEIRNFYFTLLIWSVQCSLNFW